MDDQVSALLEDLRGGVIVSCQTDPANPLHGPVFAAALARAAELGGASAIRADGPQDIAAIRQAVRLPIVGIYTIPDPAFPVAITPTLEAAIAIGRAGADIIAIDGTSRRRAGGLLLEELIAQIHHELGLPVHADVDSAADGIAARAAGAIMVGSSVTGYAGPGDSDEPDVELVARLVAALDCPVVAERHYATPEQVRRAFDAGAHAVVVGSAITDPVRATRSIVAACPPAGSMSHTTGTL